MSDAAAGILRAETRLARTAEWARGVVARQPASVGIAAVLVATTVIIDLAVPAGSPLRHGHGRAGARATPSLLLAHQPIELLLGIVATLLLLGFAERRIGTRRALVAYVATAAVSFGAAALIRFAVMDVFGSGAPAGYRAATIPLYAPAVGALMAASAFTGPLWRRRIRVLGFAAAATFVLFEGSFSGVVTLVAALAGFAVGIALRSGSGRRQTRLTWARSSHHEARVLLSSLVTISAVGPLLAALSPTPVGPLAPLGALFRDTLPTTSLSMACRVTSQAVGTDFVLNPYGECTRALALDGLHTPGTVALGFLPLVVLFVTAFFIRRGRRLAVVVAIAVNTLLGAVSASTFLATPVPAGGPGARFGALHALLSGISALVPWAIAVVLVLLLPHFTVRAEARTVRRLLVAVAATAVGLGAAYVLAGSLESDVFVPSVSGAGLVVSAVERLVPVGFIGLDRLGPVPTGGVSRVLFENIGWLFWAVVVVATGLACTHRGTAPGSRQRRAALDRILRRGVAGNLAFMSTWEGMSLWFTADERAAVAYRQVGTIVLTTGDPLCSDEDAPEVVAGFARWCDDQGLVPVFYSVRSALRPLFRSLSWYDLPVGEETVLRPRTFSLQGKKWQDVRSSMNRAAKEGVRA
ncbi:Phosphatidylglycerol lysyltransferase [Frondihabitans sp. 762G35]|nr:Phosphatidylglycerol lysyltransferase [Frondihabitans sp. 762G35]